MRSNNRWRGREAQHEGRRVFGRPLNFPVRCGAWTWRSLVFWYSGSFF
jgi:hypothetical protein